MPKRRPRPSRRANAAAPTDNPITAHLPGGGGSAAPAPDGEKSAKKKTAPREES